jgi:hypothetical protein
LGKWSSTGEEFFDVMAGIAGDTPLKEYLKSGKQDESPLSSKEHIPQR